MDIKTELELLKKQARERDEKIQALEAKVHTLEEKDKEKDSIIRRMASEINDLFNRQDILETFLMRGYKLVKKLSRSRRPSDSHDEAFEYAGDIKSTFNELFSITPAPKIEREKKVKH